MQLIALADGSVRPEVLADPYRVYAKLRADTPVVFDGGVGAWLVSRCDDVRALALDERLKAGRSRSDFRGRLRTSGRALSCSDARDGSRAREHSRPAARGRRHGGPHAGRGRCVHRVLLLPGSANRDPSRFERPDAFEPGRAERLAALSFGIRPHHCPGSGLAPHAGRGRGPHAAERGRIHPAVAWTDLEEQLHVSPPGRAPGETRPGLTVEGPRGQRASLRVAARGAIS